MKQFLVIAGIAAFIVVSVILAAYFGQGRSGGLVVDKGQRFKAKPGTTRKNAIALTSNKRPSTDDPEDSIARQASEMEDDEPLTVKSLSGDSEGRSGPAHDRATAAMNSGSPETGLRMLNESLALPHDEQQAAYIHEAMGQLYAQLEPPDFEKSREAFEQARALTDDPEMEQSILLKSVQVLMQAGQYEEARTQLREGARAETLSSQTDFRLRLLEGQLEAQAGRQQEAVQVYREVLEQALELPDDLDRAVALDLVRIASLRLSGLYRSLNEDGEAEALAREIKRRLKALEGAV